MGELYDIDVSNDPAVIEAEGRAGQAQQFSVVAVPITGAIQTIGGLPGPDILLSSSNGASVSAAANTITFSLSQDLRSTASPTFNAITLTTALTVGNGGTGATTASGARTNLNIDDIATKKSNLSASAAPGVNDDNTAGYAVGSVWIDVSADDGYLCLDASTGAAVWKKTTP